MHTKGPGVDGAVDFSVLFQNVHHTHLVGKVP